MPAGVFGYHFGQCDQKGKEEALERIGPRMAEIFRITRKSLIEGTGLRNLPPGPRLMAYRQRRPEIWDELMLADPELVKKQQQDWRELEQKAMRGQIIQDTTGTLPPDVGGAPDLSVGA